MKWTWKNKARRLITLLIDGEPTAHTGIVGNPPKLPDSEKEWPAFEAKRAAAFCFKQLASRDYPSSVLRQKMRERYVSETAIEEAIAACSPYLDDADWIRRFIAMELKKAHGPRMIRQKLRLKGLDPNLVEVALAEIDIDPTPLLERYSREALLRRGYDLN